MPVQGVNAPGNYTKDHTRDPVEYWVKERDERKAGTSSYAVAVTPVEPRGIGRTE